MSYWYCRELQSVRLGRLPVLRNARQRHTYFKNINPVESTFMTLVGVDFFETNRKRLVVRAQCCPSHQHASSHPRQKLADIIVLRLLPQCVRYKT
jgi:hypothetical protein